MLLCAPPPTPPPHTQAPEVMRGGAATPAADVFSFGVVLWELLTWQLPWVTGDGNAWHIVGAVMAGRRPAIPAREELPGEDTAAFQGAQHMLKRSWIHLTAWGGPWELCAFLLACP
jgi:serine/threonine protein kinase